MGSGHGCDSCLSHEAVSGNMVVAIHNVFRKRGTIKRYCTEKPTGLIEWFPHTGIVVFRPQIGRCLAGGYGSTNLVDHGVLLKLELDGQSAPERGGMGWD